LGDAEVIGRLSKGATSLSAHVYLRAVNGTVVRMTANAQVAEIAEIFYSMLNSVQTSGM
jgi:hypothetical protein